MNPYPSTKNSFRFCVKIILITSLAMRNPSRRSQRCPLPGPDERKGLSDPPIRRCRLPESNRPAVGAAFPGTGIKSGGRNRTALLLVGTPSVRQELFHFLSFFRLTVSSCSSAFVCVIRSFSVLISYFVGICILFIIFMCSIVVGLYSVIRSFSMFPQ